MLSQFQVEEIGLGRVAGVFPDRFEICFLFYLLYFLFHLGLVLYCALPFLLFLSVVGLFFCEFVCDLSSLPLTARDSFSPPLHTVFLPRFFHYFLSLCHFTQFFEKKNHLSFFLHCPNLIFFFFRLKAYLDFFFL